MDSKKQKVYRLFSKNSDKVYIGKTTLTLKMRLRRHKDRYSNYSSDKPTTDYYTSYEVFKDGDVDIELLEEYEMDIDKQFVLRREGHYIKTLPSCVNKQIAGRTRQEYYADNKNIMNKKKREETIICSQCGIETNRHHLRRHQRTTCSKKIA